MVHSCIWHLTARHRRTIDLAHRSRGHLTGHRLLSIPRYPKHPRRHANCHRKQSPCSKLKKKRCQQSHQRSGHRLIKDGHVIEQAANRFISAKVSAHGFHGLHKAMELSECRRLRIRKVSGSSGPNQGNLAELRTSSFSKGLTRSSKPSNSWQICNISTWAKTELQQLVCSTVQHFNTNRIAYKCLLILKVSGRMQE